jgi:hypothetical protein
MGAIKKKVLRRRFGLTKREGNRYWRKVHNVELYYPKVLSSQKSRRMRWVRHLAHIEEKRTAYKVLVGKPEESR